MRQVQQQDLQRIQYPERLLELELELQRNLPPATLTSASPTVKPTLL